MSPVMKSVGASKSRVVKAALDELSRLDIRVDRVETNKHHHVYVVSPQSGRSFRFMSLSASPRSEYCQCKQVRQEVRRRAKQLQFQAGDTVSRR